MQYKDSFQTLPRQSEIAYHFDMTRQAARDFISTMAKKGYVQRMGKYEGVGYKFTEACLLHGHGALTLSDKTIKQVDKFTATENDYE